MAVMMPPKLNTALPADDLSTQALCYIENKTSHHGKCHSVRSFLLAQYILGRTEPDKHYTDYDTSVLFLMALFHDIAVSDPDIPQLQRLGMDSLNALMAHDWIQANNAIIGEDCIEEEKDRKLKTDQLAADVCDGLSQFNVAGVTGTEGPLMLHQFARSLRTAVALDNAYMERMPIPISLAKLVSEEVHHQLDTVVSVCNSRKRRRTSVCVLDQEFRRTKLEKILHDMTAKGGIIELLLDHVLDPYVFIPAVLVLSGCWWLEFIRS